MVSLRLPSLADLCGIRFAYLMWTRHDVTKQCSKEALFEELVDTVQADVQNVPLPDKLRPHILPHVKPAGKQLLSVLNLWRSKAQLESSQKGLTREMLLECLILNADGLINQRKTAEKLLSTSMLNNVFAFRLACINFLELEVLKLWPIVKLYILNKVMLESEQPLGINYKFACCKPYPFAKEVNPQFSLTNFNEIGMFFRKTYLESLERESFYERCGRVKDLDVYPVNRTNELLAIKLKSGKRDSIPAFPCTVEPYEVLFWINYCLLKENAFDNERLPHYSGDSGDWYEFSLVDAAFSGNVSCFDYFMNNSVKKVEYSHELMAGRTLSLEDEDNQQSCFIFHFIRLNPDEKAEMFRIFPKEMVFRFLQWPLSLTFVENTEEIWNLIPDDHKHVALLKIAAILFPRHSMLTHIRQFLSFNLILWNGKTTGMYNFEHLKSIWVNLWKISSDSKKSSVLDQFVFMSITSCTTDISLDFRLMFDLSTLKQKLEHIFLTNGGEVVLELYAAGNIGESLRNILAKHLPEELEDKDKRVLHYIGPQPLAFCSKESDMNDKNIYDDCPNPVYEGFVSVLKRCLFSSNSFDKDFFHD